MSKIRVIFREGAYNRDRFIPVEFLRGDTARGDYGDDLVCFWAPDMYATPTSTRPWKLRSSLYDRAEAAQAELVAQGKTIIIVDAYRPIAAQEKRRKERPDLAVSPEQSMHPRGGALDARCGYIGGTFEGADPATHADQEEFAAVLARHGLVRTRRDEPWHFEEED